MQICLGVCIGGRGRPFQAPVQVFCLWSCRWMRDRVKVPQSALHRRCVDAPSHGPPCGLPLFRSLNFCLIHLKWAACWSNKAAQNTTLGCSGDTLIPIILLSFLKLCGVLFRIICCEIALAKEIPNCRGDSFGQERERPQGAHCYETIGAVACGTALGNQRS